jgi:hypothetical protein
MQRRHGLRGVGPDGVRQRQSQLGAAVDHDVNVGLARVFVLCCGVGDVRRRGWMHVMVVGTDVRCVDG